MQSTPALSNDAPSGLSHPHSPSLSQLQDVLDGTASLPVSVYNGAKHEGNIDVNLSSIARDTNTFTSGILMRGVAAKEYLEGIHQGNNHDDVLSAVLKAHEHDGTCLQIDPNNPNRRAIEDFLSKVYRDRMIKTVDEELRTLPQETQNLPHKKQLQKLRSDLKNSGNTLGNLKDIAKNHLPLKYNHREGTHVRALTCLAYKHVVETKISLLVRPFS